MLAQPPVMHRAHCEPSQSMSNPDILFQGRRFRVERAVQITPDGVDTSAKSCGIPARW